jgi:RNA recognition motif-containing protein
MRTKIQDIERHFEPYGKIANIRIRRNFAFVQYETQEEASAAVKNTNKRYYYLTTSHPSVVSVLLSCCCSQSHANYVSCLTCI